MDHAVPAFLWRWMKATLGILLKLLARQSGEVDQYAAQLLDDMQAADGEYPYMPYSP